MNYRLQQDKHHGQSQVCQTAIVIPLPRRVTSKTPEQFEAFVEKPSEFQIGHAIRLDQQKGWLRDIREHSLIVSCQGRLTDLENVQVEQQVLMTNPRQICEQLSHFWQPIWQRDDSHLLEPALDAEFAHFRSRLT